MSSENKNPKYETTLKSQEIALVGQDTLRMAEPFINHFGIEANPYEQPDEFIEALNQIDPRYKGGRDLVRWQLQEDQTEWPEETKDLIMRTAEQMRMLEQETPLVGNFDAVIVLGGANQANLDRSLYAAEASKNQAASFKYMIIAGSTRELLEAEQNATANYAPGAKTEFELCEAAAKVVAEQYPEISVTTFKIDEKKAGTPRVVEATLQWIKDGGALTEDFKLAAVTTQIYQKSTEMDVARVAESFGIEETFTAGNPSDPAIIAKRTPAIYLSENLRTLRAAVHAAQVEPQPY